MFEYQTYSPNQTATESVRTIVRQLLAAIYVRRDAGVMSAWMAAAIVARVVKAGLVISMLMTAFEAGVLRERKSPTSKEGTIRLGRAFAAPRLPGGFGWLCALLPWIAAGFGSQLAHALSDPTMQALLAASPRAVRTLKPVCRMLGVVLPMPPIPPTPEPEPEPPAPTVETGETPARIQTPGRPWVAAPPSGGSQQRAGRSGRLSRKWDERDARFWLDLIVPVS